MLDDTGARRQQPPGGDIILDESEHSDDTALADSQPPPIPARVPASQLEDVYRRYKRGMVRMLSRHAGDQDAAESIFHEACRVTLERLAANAIVDPARLAGFIYGTARRLALANRRLFVNSRTDFDDASLQGIADQRSDLQLQHEEDEAASTVRRLLGELPVERDRLLLIRVYLHEEDKDEVGT